MAELNDRIQKILKESDPDPSESKFLLAVSGGVDSITMVDAMHQMKLKFEIAHCNFQLRGDESDLDEKLVTQLAENLEIPFVIKRFDTKSHAKENGISTQMAARELRYEWFQELIKTKDIDFLCTAHHLNDSIETSLFNLSKGTGLKGLTGIAANRAYILRPLIHISKAELLSYAIKHKLTWREDLSNNAEEYMRTIIRNETIPSIERINPSFIETSRHSLDRLSGSQQLLDRFIGEILDRNLTSSGDSKILAHKKLSVFSEQERVVCLLGWLSQYGFNYHQVRDMDLHSNQSGKRFLSKGHELVVDREKLILSPLQISSVNIEIPDLKEQKVSINKRTYSVSKVSSASWNLVKDSSYLQMDHAKLAFPLQIRNWREGDWFTPLGMRGKKKISDFMIDRKIPLNFKREVLILVSGRNVAGIVGYQVDDRYKVNKNTEDILIVNEI